MDNDQGSPENRANKKKKGFAIFGAVTLAGLAILFFYRGYSKTHLKTDDAFVEGAIHIISSRVPGTIRSVLVRNNQPVKTGDMLVELEREILSQKLAEALASYEAERKRLEERKLLVEAKKTGIEAVRAGLDKALFSRAELKTTVSVRAAEVSASAASKGQAELDLARAESLLEKEVIPKERYDRTKTRYDGAQAALDAAVRRKLQSEVALKAHESSIRQARAALKVEKTLFLQNQVGIETQKEIVRRQQARMELAKLNLSYTDITAPTAGNVTRKSVEVGNQVQVGQPLMTIVSLKSAYIVANYKETRLKYIKPGQVVKIRIDAYPDKKFTGRVDSIMAGTGAAFSLFPPENASGNYVKVVQRVPVKIVFDNLAEAREFLRVGMSVVPTVLTKR